jgi:arylsulfatase A-like enzyme
MIRMQGLSLTNGRLTTARRAGAALIAALATACLGLLLHDADSSRAQTATPNIVVLTTDDQTVRDMLALPQTQALIGGQGASFVRSYVSFPLCCPARATWLTGQHAHNHGVLGNTPPDGGYAMLKDGETLPVWLQKRQYRTIHVGKMPNGFAETDQDYVPPGWRLPDGEFYGFIPDPPSAYYGFKLNENGVPVQYTPVDYQTDVYATKATQAIAAHKLSFPSRPLYLEVDFFAPHDPAQPAIRHDGAFASAPLPVDKSFNEKDISDKPGWLRAVRRLGGGLRSKILNRYRNRLESLLAVDEAVNQIVTQLNTSGLLGNTYVIFTSDNGFMQGQHRLHQGKFVAYDPSAKVPLLIRGPGIQPGVVPNEMVTNVDLVATILDIANADPGITIDGRSYLPFAQSPTTRSQRPILFETGRAIALADPAGASTSKRRKKSSIYVKNLDLDRTAQLSGRVIKPPKYRAIRTRRYLLIKYSDHGRELYDMAKDPLQVNSVYKNPRYKAIKKLLLKRLARLTRCAGATCNPIIKKPPKPIPKSKLKRPPGSKKKPKR